MTVHELKKALDSLPQHARVLVEGYEGGYADVAQLRLTRIDLNQHPEDYMGPHEEATAGGQEGVILFRAPNPA